jgi:glycosyltransferase involved in cell wall biosynthesis
MKILELSPFSAGICGVSTRALAEATLLAKKGHDVYLFSSDIFRGEGQKSAPHSEIINNVKIIRFSTKGSFGQNTYFWNFEKAALELKPDVIITHAYRQYYSTKALKIAKKLGIPCFLVTHAPFLDKKLRNWKLNLAVSLYDSFLGKRIINKYTKVIVIAKWEIPYLEKLGINNEKIVYIPNGIPDEFFEIPIKKNKDNNSKILFLGRIAPVKNIEVLIKALSVLNNKKIILSLVGPAEPEYKDKIVQLIKQLGLEKQVTIYPAVYDIRDKIKVIDAHGIFVLPSKREAMPTALIEAMARERIVISSNTDGGKEIIQDTKNGFLFNIDNENQLADKIKVAFSGNNINSKIAKNARLFVRQYSWKSLIKKIEKVYSS